METGIYFRKPKEHALEAMIYVEHNNLLSIEKSLQKLQTEVKDLTTLKHSQQENIKGDDSNNVKMYKWYIDRKIDHLKQLVHSTTSMKNIILQKRDALAEQYRQRFSLIYQENSDNLPQTNVAFSTSLKFIIKELQD